MTFFSLYSRCCSHLIYCFDSCSLTHFVVLFSVSFHRHFGSCSFVCVCILKYLYRPTERLTRPAIIEFWLNIYLCYSRDCGSQKEFSRAKRLLNILSSHFSFLFLFFSIFPYRIWHFKWMIESARFGICLNHLKNASNFLLLFLCFFFCFHWTIWVINGNVWLW